MKKNNNTVLFILVGIIIGAAGFFGGMQYQKTQAATVPTGFSQETGTRQGFMRNGQTGMPENRMMGGFQNRPISGEVISVDASSITVKMQDGSTKIVVLADDIAINKSSTGSKSDLKNGEKVTAFGTTNSDGSVTAKMVSIGGGMFFQQSSARPQGQTK